MKTQSNLQEKVILNGHGDPDKDEKLNYLNKIEEAVEEIRKKALQRLESSKTKTCYCSSSISSDGINKDEEDDYTPQFQAGKQKNDQMKNN